MKLLLLVLAFVLGLVVSGQAIGWTLVNAKIRSEFPDVPRISTPELAAWLNDGTRPAPVLLDVREHAEFEVSHLRNARHVAPDADAAVIALPKEQPIVTYCSVGYRSGAFAQKLRDAGYPKVLNLEGSIFQWANEGRPVFRADAKVEQVHPYARTWGLLLKKKLRATIP